MSEIKEETTVTELNEVLEEIVAPQEQEVERVVFWVDETHVKIKEVQYEIVEDYREGFELDAFNARYQDIFDKYEYIVGDWGHEKLRLKGFYESKNRLATPDKDIAFLQDYIYEFCNFGCRYFVLRRDPNVKPVAVEDEGIPKRPKNKQQKRNTKRFNNERVEEKTFIRYQSNWHMYLDYIDTKAYYNTRLSKDINMIVEWQNLYAPYRTNLFKFKIYKRDI